MRLGNRCGSAAIVGQAVACVLALSIVGCGGGGGSTSTFRGRSFTEVAAERAFYMSVDGAGRFTLAFRLAASPTWVAAQGSIGPTSQFSAQSPDGLTQFEGTATAGGDAITYTVKQSGTTIVTATAAQVAAGTATPASLVGSFMRRPGVEIAYLTADAAGHATLWLDTGAASGAALVTVAPDGVIGDAGGNTVGRLDASGSDVGLTLTKLNGSPVSVALTLTRVTRAKWTFLVFMNAANDLQEFGPLNFGQMEKIGSSADVNIVVQWKQADCAGCGSPDWVSTRRYYVTRDQHSQLVEDLGPNVDMGDWRELASFIRWTQQRYPADHYALVIWDHGAGWRSTRGAAAAVRSVSIDDDTGNEIQTWELPQALNVSPKVDLLVFDASLMQMMEVAYEVREMARYMVGSEESPPGEGYVYDAFLNDLSANPAMSPLQLATQIVTRTLESYGTNTNITQSALDLGQMQTLADRLDAFADALTFHKDAHRSELIAARRNAESYLYRDNKDLWHYAELVRSTVTTQALRTAASNLQRSLESAVVAEAHGTLHPNSNGLSVYVPDPSSYLLSYSSLALTRVTNWDEWLQNQPPG